MVRRQRKNGKTAKRKRSGGMSDEPTASVAPTKVWTYVPYPKYRPPLSPSVPNRSVPTRFTGPAKDIGEMDLVQQNEQRREQLKIKANKRLGIVGKSNGKGGGGRKKRKSKRKSNRKSNKRPKRKTNRRMRREH